MVLNQQNKQTPTKNMLVEIFEEDWIKPCMQYQKLKMQHAEPRCLVRKEVKELLKKASTQLPPGMCFIIWDAWRPLALQKELYTKYRQTIIEEFKLTNLPEQEQNKFINQYIAEPKERILHPPAHTTGGAIDITIANKNGKYLSMGTDFDEFCNMTKSDWFEYDHNNKNFSPKHWTEIKNNRRLLCTILTEVGFANLESEWWHFDYGNDNWAIQNNSNAFYQGIFE